jgi:polysaccharide biosynthesis/export protein
MKVADMVYNTGKGRGRSDWLKSGLLLTAACGLMGGCEQPKHREAEVPPPPRELYQPFTERTGIPAETVVFPDYRLNVGDLLEVIYHVRFDIDKAKYQLKIEDVINVKFPFQPEFDQTTTVQADGSIRLWLLGDVEAIGLTADELEAKVRKLYARHIKDPQLTITFEKSNIKIEELKKAITTAPRGQSRLMPVKPDGTIDLAYVGRVAAFGKTVEMLRGDINKKYAEIGFPEIDVTVQINEVAPQKVYVMGEVHAPGVVETRTAMTLLQAIAAAGGTTPTAEPSKVLFVRRKGMPVPQATIVDVRGMLKSPKPGEEQSPLASAFQYDIWMDDFDLVYVPKSGLAEFDDWVDQVFTKGVRSILPYSWSTGLSFGYEIRAAPTTVRASNKDNRNINVQVGP